MIIKKAAKHISRTLRYHRCELMRVSSNGPPFCIHTAVTMALNKEKPSVPHTIIYIAENTAVLNAASGKRRRNFPENYLIKLRPS